MCMFLQPLVNMPWKITSFIQVSHYHQEFGIHVFFPTRHIC